MALVRSLRGNGTATQARHDQSPHGGMPWAKGCLLLDDRHTSMIRRSKDFLQPQRTPRTGRCKSPRIVLGMARMGNAIVGAASLVASPLLPILWLQGRHVRKHTPRLPEAAGPTAGTISAVGVPLRLLVIGESTVAGVGAPDHAHALTGQIAAALATRTGRTVHWHAVGKIGATARVARTRLVPEIPEAPVDIIVLALGVNDVLRFHAPGRWTRDLTQLITDLRERVGAAPIVLASVPPMGRFPAFPQPLRGVLGWRAAALDRAARRCVPTLVRVAHSPAHLDPAGGMFWYRSVPPLSSRISSLGITDCRVRNLAPDCLVNMRPDKELPAASILRRDKRRSGF